MVEGDMQIDQVPVEQLIPYARNARTHSDAQIAQIAASIREFGFNNPILVDGAKGIIAGHGRLAAARKLGLEAVPVIELAHMSETQKRAFIIADNRIAENAGWDQDMLRLELEELNMEGFDLELTGFDESITGAFDIPEDNKDIDEEAMAETENECPKCGFKW
jgi:ParB-like chromosome segregation protein Spo0J